MTYPKGRAGPQVPGLAPDGTANRALRRGYEQGKAWALDMVRTAAQHRLAHAANAARVAETFEFDADTEETAA